MYERTLSVQQQAVSNLLTSDKGRSFGEEVTNLSSGELHQCATSQTLTIQHQKQQLVGMPFGGLFGPMSQCSLNICPNNFVVCVNYTNSDRAVEKEFDSVVSDMD